MKKSVFILFVCFLILTGCKGEASDTVSREEYEDIVAEVNSLKTQIESMENKNIETQQQAEIQESESEEPLTHEKELLGEFSFDWDENNKIVLFLYQEGEDYFVEGHGTYEEGKLSFLQENYYWMCEFTSLYAKEAEINYTVGDEEYTFLVSDGEVVVDTIPMENKEYIPNEYYDKRDEWVDQIKYFYDLTIWS